MGGAWVVVNVYGNCEHFLVQISLNIWQHFDDLKHFNFGLDSNVSFANHL